MPSTCSLAASTCGAPWTEAKAGHVNFTGKGRPRPIGPMPTNTTCSGWTTATWWCPTTAGCFAGTIQGCPICLRVCKSPKRMRWACTQPSQVNSCWDLKTTARLIKPRCIRHVCSTETGSIASSTGTPRTLCMPRRTTDCCTALPTEEGP